MAERKRTPDILSEIMSGAAEAPEAAPQPAPSKPSKKPAGAQPAKKPRPVSPSQEHAPLAGSREHAGPQGWQYLCASLQYYKGEPHAWRVRFENGRELDDWFIGPAVDEYLRQMGEEGWELCAASAGERLYAANDTRQLYFKRPLAR